MVKPKKRGKTQPPNKFHQKKREISRVFGVKKKKKKKKNRGGKTKKKNQET